MYDQLVCVKNTLKGIAETGYELPSWVVGLAQQLVTSGSVLWQLWHLLMANKGSGWYAAAMLLRLTQLYLTTQMLSVVGTATQRFGPYAGMKFISPAVIAGALPG